MKTKTKAKQTKQKETERYLEYNQFFVSLDNNSHRRVPHFMTLKITRIR